MIYTFTYLDYCRLDDDIASNQNLISLHDTITFKDLIENPIVWNITNLLHFSDRVIVHGNRTIKLIDTIDLDDNVNKNYNFVLEDSLFLSDTNWGHPVDFIDFIDNVTALYGQFITDTITFTDKVFLNKSKIINLLDALIFTDISKAYNLFNTKKLSLIYNQILSDSPPTPKPQTECILTCTNGWQLTLFRPSFGNTFVKQYNNILEETRGGNQILAPNSTYAYVPYVASFHYKFEYLSPDEASGFLQFIKNTLGLPMYLTDYESNVWWGYLKTGNPILNQEDVANLWTEWDFEILPYKTLVNISTGSSSGLVTLSTGTAGEGGGIIEQVLTYSLTGPAIVKVGVPSTFTVAMGPGNTGLDTIIPYSALGATISPASIQIAPYSPPGTSATFIVTEKIIGRDTISTTNIEIAGYNNLQDPPSLSIIVTS